MIDDDVAAAADWPLGGWVPAPAQRLYDQETGVGFDVLTGGTGNNRHIYFNRANFSYDGRQLIFLSDRTGSWQVYAYDIAGQRLPRLTDAALDPGRPSLGPCRLLPTPCTILIRLSAPMVALSSSAVGTLSVGMMSACSPYQKIRDLCQKEDFRDDDPCAIR